ncbi:hypothetical protein [Lentzea sp. NPDC004782]|uniref:hypothetical protein n=1 Tax=Lentzea sp. NPDC004782 TaxID=3154458 RepID=UPI00339E7A16
MLHVAGFEELLMVIVANGLTKRCGEVVLTDPRAISEPEIVAGVLVAAGCPPYRLAVDQDDLETFFLRVVAP